MSAAVRSTVLVTPVVPTNIWWASSLSMNLQVRASGSNADSFRVVFIDAMGTGFSRPDKPSYGPDFGGVENDLAAFGEFIRSFLRSEERRVGKECRAPRAPSR